MKCAESNGGPDKGRSYALLSTVVTPSILLLGSCLSFDSGDAPEMKGPSVNVLQETQGETPPMEIGVPTGEAEQEEESEEVMGDGPSAGFEPGPGRGPEPDQAPATVDSEAKLDGYINFRSRSRWADDAGDDDHDLYAVVGVDYATAGPDSWGIHLLLRGSWGLNSQDPNSVFYSVQDTYSDELDGQIYRAYVDAPVGDVMGLARLGRMAIYDTPATAYFDGVQLETAPVGPTQVIVGAYGGLSVHQFEGWPSDEWMGGLYTRFRPWIDGSLRLDWMRLTDDARFGAGDNDLISANLSHRLGDNVRLEGSYSLLDGDSNDMRLKAFWAWVEQDLTVRVSFYSLLEKQENLSFELNPFYNFLSTYFPYDQTQVVVSKAFGDALELYGGVDMRRVDDEGDIGRFNRDFDRYYLTAALLDSLPMNTTLSVTGEVWDSPGTDISTWGVDLTSQVQEETKVSLGSYYSLYKYYFDVSSERDDVRTFYAEIRNTLSESTNLMARYEYEDEELDSFHSLWLGVTWRF